jgi:NADPH2:quinone reductase
MSLVNPLTAIGFLDIAQQLGAKTIIHTAAASSLGRMLNRYL